MTAHMDPRLPSPIMIAGTYGKNALYRWGSGDVHLLFLHGNSVDSRIFLPLIDVLPRDKLTIHCLDLPGHGCSEHAAHREAYRAPRLRETIRQILTTIPGTRVILVGHSCGGHLLAECADSVPNPAALALISTPPLTDSIQGLSPYSADGPARLLFQSELSDNDIEQYLNSEPGLGKPQRELLSSAIHAADPRFREQIGHSLAHHEIRDEVSVISRLCCPTALFVGRRDTSLNHAYLGALSRKLLRRSRMCYCPSAGHYPMLAKSRDFFDHFVQFIFDVM